MYPQIGNIVYLKGLKNKRAVGFVKDATFSVGSMSIQMGIKFRLAPKSQLRIKRTFTKRRNWSNLIP